MIYLTGDIISLSDSNRWGMSSTHPMADWYVFYSTMDGYGFWCDSISTFERWNIPVYDDEMFPF